MHLALAIGGCTIAELEQRMSEREFNLWHLYANQFQLPARRQDLYAAQIALVVARACGSPRGNIGLRDFLFDRPEEGPALDATVGGNVLGAVASVGVRRLGQGRKKKVN